MQYLNKKCEKCFDRNILEWRLNIRGRVCDQNIKLFSVVFRFSAQARRTWNTEKSFIFWSQTLPAHVQTLHDWCTITDRICLTSLVHNHKKYLPHLIAVQSQNVFASPHCCTITKRTCLTITERTCLTWLLHNHRTYLPHLIAAQSQNVIASYDCCTITERTCPPDCCTITELTCLTWLLHNHRT